MTKQAAIARIGLAATANPRLPERGLVGQVSAVDADGSIHVATGSGATLVCDWLEGPLGLAVRLAPGDQVLMIMVEGAHRPIVLGRVGSPSKEGVAAANRNCVVEAGESLSLKCGESSIDLRADGKVMIRGEDVLVRAKKTKRIRAGTVSIN